MRNQEKYNTEKVKVILEKDGFFLLDEYVNAKTKMLCKDSDGYYVYIILSNYLFRHGFGRRFDRKNPYTIQNINHYLKLNNIPFECISDTYKSASDILIFRCNRCGKIVELSWRNVNKNDNANRNHIVCSNCDGRNESLHASILKQLFLHNYPDTIVEDKTYRNPITDKICPTDIVNHRLKIAIEIQSMLDNNDTVLSIANKLDINPHRIYDAIYSKKLFYPSNYKYINNVKSEYIS